MPNTGFTITGLAHLSEAPARWIDQSFLEEPQSVGNLSFWFIKVRIYSLMLFLAQAIAALAALLLSISYIIGILIASDEQQEFYLEQLRSYSFLFSKNALGLIASLASLFTLNLCFPQNFSLLFLPDRQIKGISNGGKNNVDESVEIRKPKDVVELQTLIKEANEHGYAIIPVGGGRSQGKQFIPSKISKSKRIVVDLSAFNDIKIDEECKTATVGAGCIWSQVQDQANKKKLSICSAQASLSIFTIGGSIGIDAHGWDIHNGMLSKTIESLTIVTPTGELKVITPDDESFCYINGGLGLVGIVVNATIRLTPNIKVQRTTKDVSPDDFHQYFQTIRAEGNTVLSLARLELGEHHRLERIFMENYDKVPGDDEAYEAPNFHMEADNGRRLDRILVAFLRTFNWVRKYYWESERREFIEAQPIMTRNEAMHFGIRSMYNHSESQAEWLQEYFVPCDKLAGFLKELGELLNDHQVPLMNATIRYVPQKDAPLSYASDGDRYAVVICFNQKLNNRAIKKTAEWQRTAYELTCNYGGSIYLAYQNNLSPDHFEASYPRYAEFIDYKCRVDPNKILSSGFYEKYLKLQDVNHVRVVMSDSKLKRAFSGFLKNVLYRVEPEPLFVLLEDILTYSDTQEEIYAELCYRLSEIRPSVLGDLQRTLTSLFAIKKDLGDQALRFLQANKVTQIAGILEVGSPGRYIDEYQKRGIKISGPIYASDDEETFMSTFPKKTYQYFIPLNYADVSPFKTITENSVELITCYVGLHHFDESNLHQFLSEMRRVLKPGGIFLLVDHDVTNDNIVHFSHLAHFVFNAVNNVSIDNELYELRNFQPVSYWQKALKEHDIDFLSVDGDFVRTEDPTNNRMVGFKASAKIQYRANKSSTLFAARPSEEQALELACNCSLTN